MKEKEVQETALRKHDCLIDFNAKMKGLNTPKKGFRIITVANYKI